MDWTADNQGIYMAVLADLVAGGLLPFMRKYRSLLSLPMQKHFLTRWYLQDNEFGQLDINSLLGHCGTVCRDFITKDIWSTVTPRDNDMQQNPDGSATALP
jgi:hypothetical protein